MNPTKVADGFTFPESPRWHGGRQAFYHVDFDEGEIWEFKDGTTRRLHRFDSAVSGLAFDDSDGFYVAVVFEKCIMHLAHALEGHGTATRFADVSEHFVFGINDMTRGQRGEIYLGGLNFNAMAWFKDPTIPMADGTFLTIAPDATMAPVDCSVMFPNGIVISAGGDRLMMADSYREKINCWEIRPDGSLGPQRLWADVPGEQPDGMSLDAEGAIWFASHNRVVRVREGGDITDAVELPEGHVTACALGGDDGRTLLITAAASINRDIVRASRTGVLYEMRVDVPGAGLPSLY